MSLQGLDLWTISCEFTYFPTIPSQLSHKCRLFGDRLILNSVFTNNVGDAANLHARYALDDADVWSF